MKNKNLEDVYIFLMEQSMRQFKIQSRKIFLQENIDITIDQWIVLKRVYEERYIGQKELAQSTFKDPAALSRILEILEWKDMLRREVIGNNKRAKIVLLLPAGEKIVEDILPIAQGLRAKGLEGVSKADQENLMKILKKIQTNLT